MFKVVITRVEEKKTTKNGGYTVMDTEYISREEYNGLVHDEKRKWELIESGQYRHEIFGYPPEQQVTALSETKCYEQTVEAMDLIAVIRAVNGIPE